MKNFKENGLYQIHERNGQPTMDSRDLAKELGNEHRALLQLIQTHKKTIEKDFGKLLVEMLKSNNQASGRPTRIIHLTEDQALFVTTLARNSQEAILFKGKIIKSFLFFRKLSTQAAGINYEGVSSVTDKNGRYYSFTQIKAAKSLNVSDRSMALYRYHYPTEVKYVREQYYVSQTFVAYLTGTLTRCKHKTQMVENRRERILKSNDYLYGQKMLEA